MDHDADDPIETFPGDGFLVGGAGIEHAHMLDVLNLSRF